MRLQQLSHANNSKQDLGHTVGYVSFDKCQLNKPLYAMHLVGICRESDYICTHLFGQKEDSQWTKVKAEVWGAILHWEYE